MLTALWDLEKEGKDINPSIRGIRKVFMTEEAFEPNSEGGTNFGNRVKVVGYRKTEGSSSKE